MSLELNGTYYDLSAASRVFGDVSSWLASLDPVGEVKNLIAGLQELSADIASAPLAPLDVQEVWASGVTYLRSREARMEESDAGKDFYRLVYDAERPELFFKSTASRVMGPGDNVRIRRDSSWNVPEPELALVLSSSGKVVGYTIGNDMSSRSIEGENPLYLPQAKVYDGSCSLGPAILLNDGAAVNRTIEMTITRDGAAVFNGSTSTERIKRTFSELAEYLFREMTFPNGVFLLTGTGIVPPDDFTLRSGDVVTINIDGIGKLENPVE